MKNVTLNFCLQPGKEISANYLDYLPQGNSYSKRSNGCYVENIETMTSAICGFKFKARGLYNECEYFLGYQIEFAPNECSLAIPLLTNNELPQVVQIGHMLLQYFLLAKDCSVELLSLFKIEHCEIVRATFGFYIHARTLATAQRTLSNGVSVLRGLHNYRRPKAHQHSKPLKYHGSAKRGYWELCRRHHTIRLSAIQDSKYWLDQAANSGRHTILKDDFAGRCQEFIFIEMEVGNRWLQMHNLNIPSAWSVPVSLTCQPIQAQLRSDFGIDRSWATEKLSAEKLSKFDRRVQRLIVNYFDGNDISDAAFTKADYRVMRRHVIDALGVDLSVPWIVMKNHVLGRDVHLLLEIRDNFQSHDKFQHTVSDLSRFKLKLPTVQEMQAYIDIY